MDDTGIDFGISKTTIHAKPRKLKTDWELTEITQVEFNKRGSVPKWLYWLMGLGRFGKWLDSKTYKYRKQKGWLTLKESYEEAYLNSVEAFYKKVDREILDSLHGLNHDRNH